MPLIRVVIPTFNRAPVIQQAVDSVLNQTFKDFDLVVVDDGSEDDTASVVASLAVADPRVRFVRQENAGAAQARNRGIDLPGNHEYVAFLDSDDLWRPYHLECCVAALTSIPGSALAFGPMELIDLDGLFTREGANAIHDDRMEFLRRQRPPSIPPDVYLMAGGDIWRELLSGEFAPRTASVVVRRDAVARNPWFDGNLEVMEDLDFFMHLVPHPFVLVDSIQGSVRRFGDNLTASRDLSSPTTVRRRLAALRFLKNKLGFCNSESEMKVVHRQISECAYLVGQCFAEQGLTTDARGAYFESLRYRRSRMCLKSLAGCFLPPVLRNFMRRTLR